MGRDGATDEKRWFRRREDLILLMRRLFIRRCSSTAVVYDKVDKDVNNEMAIVEEVNVKKGMEEEASGLF